MNFVIVGAGYTGLSVIKKLSNDYTTYITRSFKGFKCASKIIDLDDNINSIDLQGPYNLLYTVPPNPNLEIDNRLPSLLNNISTLPNRFVYISTSGVYGNHYGRLVNELTSPKPQTTRAKKRVVAEQYLNDWCYKKNIELIVLRVSGIYGPQRLGLERINKNLTIINENEAMISNRIHIDDLTTSCIGALKDKKASGIYNISDGDFRSNTWFIKKLCELKGIPSPKEISYEEAIQTWDKKRVSFLKESRRLDNRKLRDDLKIKLLYSNAEKGIKASL